MDYILVTGGLGFIGSHIVIQLVENGKNVIIIDNLSNSNLNVFFTLLEMTDKIRKQNKTALLCFKNDICDVEPLDKIFQLHQISGIIHLAAHKAVNESIQLPLQYYENNIGSTITLLKLCNKYKVSHFIFSSSATVYGNSPSPLSESSTVGINIGSPYGRTKFFIEQILYDFYQSNPETKVVILRYFNPVGAHVSGKIGENPNGIPNNLMPFLLRVAIKNNLDSSYDDTYSNVKIFGNTYNTVDGTASRDYIHVVDLADAHVKCFDYLQTNPNVSFDIFNIGTGKATTVLQLIETFMSVNKVDIPYVFCDKRKGDVETLYCHTDKSKTILGWEPKYDLDTICKDAYRFIVHSAIQSLDNSRLS